MNILVTGGLGYIGTHTVIKLLEAGHYVILSQIQSMIVKFVKNFI